MKLVRVDAIIRCYHFIAASSEGVGNALEPLASCWARKGLIAGPAQVLTGSTSSLYFFTNSAPGPFVQASRAVVSIVARSAHIRLYFTIA